MRYEIQFDFDCEGEPPSVFITEDGTSVIEVLEEPVCTAPGWSWNPEDWKPGELAERCLLLLNS